MTIVKEILFYNFLHVYVVLAFHVDSGWTTIKSFGQNAFYESVDSYLQKKISDSHNSVDSLHIEASGVNLESHTSNGINITILRNA